MVGTKRPWTALACGACFFLGVLVGPSGVTGLAAADPPPKDPPPVFPMTARLGANLYLQTSAEYRACRLQTFRSSELRLAAVLATARPRPTNPAVVMDHDETVIDNSAFQTYLLRNKREYSDPLWAVYEEQYPRDVTLVPGAKRFVARAKELGATVVFISNRVGAFRKSTVSALTDLGVVAADLDDRLFLKPTGGSSDKAAWRERVAARSNVLLYFGDILRDFSKAFAAPKLAADAPPDAYRTAISDRWRLAADAAGHWGIDWFVLPNPVYGEWERLIGRDPIAVLHPTSMPAPK